MNMPLSALQAEVRATESRIHDELRRLLALAPGVGDVDLELVKVPVMVLGQPVHQAPDNLLGGVKIRLTL